MENTGERQVAQTLEGIAPDHRQRYSFAGGLIGYERGESNILDAACGIGYGSYLMARLGHHITGVDIDEQTVKFAKEYYSYNGRTNYLQGDLGVLKKILDTNSFDAVVSFETIEHVEDDVALIKTFSELSDTLICSVPNQNVIPFSKATNPFHFRHYTPDEFEALLSSAGYKNISYQTQVDKWEGAIVPGNYGRTIIAVARK